MIPNSSLENLCKSVILGASLMLAYPSSEYDCKIFAFNSSDKIAKETKENKKHAERIFFESKHDGNRELYYVNTDGGNLVRVTSTPNLHESNPNISPDGTKVCFDGFDCKDSSLQIYVMDINGTNVMPLTKGPDKHTKPVWSHDGKRIAYTKNSGGLYSKIFVMNSDGTAVQQLRNDVFCDDFDATWSPDDKKLAFARRQFIINPKDNLIDLIDSNIYIIKSDGSGEPEQLTSEKEASEPYWSPDGKNIVYISDGEVAILDFTTKKQRKLTAFFEKAMPSPYYYKIEAKRASWSPDGSKLVIDVSETIHNIGYRQIDCKTLERIFLRHSDGVMTELIDNGSTSRGAIFGVLTQS